MDLQVGVRAIELIALQSAEKLLGERVSRLLSTVLGWPFGAWF